jgi:hypothetical protein
MVFTVAALLTGSAGDGTVALHVQPVTDSNNVARANILGGDFYVSSASKVTLASILTGTINKEKFVWSTYSADNSSKFYIPGLNTIPPTIPPVIAGAIIPSKTVVKETSPTPFDAVAAYGGAGVVGTLPENAPGLQTTITAKKGGTDLATIPSWITFTQIRSIKTYIYTT